MFRNESLDNQIEIARKNPYQDQSLGSHLSDFEVLSYLLKDKDGVCIGEVHDDANSKKVLVEHMAELCEKGVEIIYLEHLFFEEHQPLLDEYFLSESDDFPSALAEHLRKLDEGHRVDEQCQFSTLVRAAKQHNIKIVAVDNKQLYAIGGDAFYDDREARFTKLNRNISQQVEQRRQSGTDKGKFIVFVGSRHVGLNIGKGAVGLGIDNLLGIPSLVFTRASQGSTKRVVSTPHDFFYSMFRGNVVIDRASPPSLASMKILFGLLKTGGQSIRITEVISELHLRGVSIYSGKDEGLYSVLDVAAMNQNFEAECYVGSLLSFETPKDTNLLLRAGRNADYKQNHRARKLLEETEEKRLTETSPLIKTSIVVTRENCSYLPDFFQSLKDDAEIEYLEIGGELSCGMVADLLQALKGNPNIKKLTVNSDVADHSRMAALLNKFARETQYRIELETRNISSNASKQLKLQTRLAHIVQEGGIIFVDGAQSDGLCLHAELRKPASVLGDLEEKIDILQARIISQFKDELIEFCDSNRSAESISQITSFFRIGSDFSRLVKNVKQVVESEKEVSQLREKIEGFFEMNKNYERGSIEAKLQRVLARFSPYTQQIDSLLREGRLIDPDDAAVEADGSVTETDSVARISRASA